MEFLTIIILSLILLGLAVLAMGVNVFIRKRKFPNTHIGGNKEMIKRDIYCAKTMDKIENKKAKEEVRIKNLKAARLADN